MVEVDGMMLPVDLYVCNCAGENSGKLLTGLKSAHRINYLMARHYILPPLVSGHMWNRPYCSECLRLTRQPLYNGLRKVGVPEYENQALDQVVRQLEDARAG